MQSKDHEFSWPLTPCSAVRQWWQRSRLAGDASTVHISWLDREELDAGVSSRASCSSYLWWATFWNLEGVFFWAPMLFLTDLDLLSFTNQKNKDKTLMIKTMASDENGWSSSSMLIWDKREYKLVILLIVFFFFVFFVFFWRFNEILDVNYDLFMMMIYYWS